MRKQSRRKLSRAVSLLASAFPALLTLLLYGCTASESLHPTALPSSTPGRHAESQTLPTSITPPVGAVPIADVTALSAGAYHVCALTRLGEALCWGDNEHGQLGDQTTVDRALAAGVQGLGAGVTKIVAGYDNTCAITSRGALLCWGLNLRGTVGDGTTENARTMPAQVVGLESGVTDVAVGRAHACAVKVGNVLCWGDNTYGQLGSETNEQFRNKPIEIPGLNGNVASIGAGWFHTCALMEARTVMCWGNNNLGQLGNGQADTGRVSMPVRVQGLPQGVVALAVGGGHNCVLTETGEVACWGGNNYGQLGDGTTTVRARPVEVGRLDHDVTAIAAGTGQTCGLDRFGVVRCWGHDWYGELGDGTSGRDNINVRPVEMRVPDRSVAAIAMGRFHTCLLLNDGGVVCVGRNGFGELGDGTRAMRLAHVPVLVKPSDG